MAETTNIEWASRTFSPWIGCTKVHEGCENCYAEDLAGRMQVEWGPGGTRRKTAESSWRKVQTWDKHAKDQYEDRVFPSLCDVFEEWDGEIVNSYGFPVFYCHTCGASNDFGATVVHREDPTCGVCDRSRCAKITMHDLRGAFFDLIKATPNLTWILLTKRLNEAMRWFDAGPMRHHDNVWLLYSASVQKHVDDSFDVLTRLRHHVAHVGLCLEPLLEQVEIINGATNRFSRATDKTDDGIGIEWTDPGASFAPYDWVIVGGESGSNARECRLEWIWSLIADANLSRTPIFVKQLGSLPTLNRLRYFDSTHPKGGDKSQWPEGLRVQQFPQ